MSKVINGVLLLDKPRGVTSNTVLQRAKQLLRAKKAGHTGSLDLIATGLLPLCFGEATKVSQFLLDADKQYWGILKLGQETETGDAEGEMIAEAEVNATEETIQTVLQDFIGPIDQVPSKYSAIKQGGEPLYKKVRRGKEIDELKPRRVHIHDLKFLKLEGNYLELEITSSKGTYIRTLASDIGRALGCYAYIVQLRRTAAGPFTVAEAVSLETLEGDSLEERQARLLPPDSALALFPAVELGETASYFLLQGQPVMVPHLPEAPFLRLYNREGRFLGVGSTTSDGRVAPKRLFHQPG